MKFGAYLTQLREAAGLSKTDLAKKMGISLVYFSKIERGIENQKPPNVARCNQIAEALALTQPQKETLLDLAFQERNYKEFSAFKKSSVKDSASEVEYNSKMVKVPVLGKCPASAKHWVNDEVECYESISRSFIGDRRMYIIRVHGDSMNKAGLDDGALVLVDADKQPSNGNIVVARVDHECTVKRFYKTDHTITLMPDSLNPKHAPMTFKKGNLIQIRGVVDFLYLKRVS